ncbi:hypothetical protein LTS18_006514 [Coniosporium uncinatum]|uniref:Uncharacterized protein n=1 Tax=Coniosporium uncinatum TaxID=93489 RepID=A0ACC3DQL8_9PEZI|nr:hypothetical protein LTS18_006514 [Coniosporium uncinatum]
MATRGTFNTKSPTVKRIMKEASELANNASTDFHAEPLEDNLFEWHFTLKGPPAPSSFAGGIYHGRIVLPPTYPLRPPSFRFMTPSGRFEANREICLSISGFHEETWQPAWGIRTALVAIRSFMDTDAKGQVGGLESTEAVRKRMAVESVGYRCASCGKTNAEIMVEREEVAKELGDEAGKKEYEVPEELRLAYREDLGKKEGAEESSASEPKSAGSQPVGPVAAPPAQVVTEIARPAAPQTPVPTRTVPHPAPSAQIQQRRAVTSQNEAVPAWIDKAIYGIIAALAFLVLRRLAF